MEPYGETWLRAPRTTHHFSGKRGSTVERDGCAPAEHEQEQTAQLSHSPPAEYADSEPTARDRHEPDESPRRAAPCIFSSRTWHGELAVPERERAICKLRIALSCTC